MGLVGRQPPVQGTTRAVQLPTGDLDPQFAGTSHSALSGPNPSQVRGLPGLHLWSAALGGQEQEAGTLLVVVPANPAARVMGMLLGRVWHLATLGPGPSPHPFSF